MTDLVTPQRSTSRLVAWPQYVPWPRLGWTWALTLVAAALIFGGATSAGGGNVGMVMLGVAIGVIGVPLLLISVVATGVRIGLRDHDLFREWQNGD